MSSSISVSDADVVDFSSPLLTILSSIISAKNYLQFKLHLIPLTFIKAIFRPTKAFTCESAIHVTVIALLHLHKFLFDPSFISQIREYSHESIIVDIDVIQNDRMVNLAKFLDEFLYGMLFSLIFSVQHNRSDQAVL